MSTTPVERFLLAIALMALVWAAPAAAQCTDQQATAKPGRWLRDPNALADPDYTKLQRQYPGLAAKAERATALIRQAMPTLVGVEVLTNRKVNSRTLAGTGRVRFGLSAGVFGYYCVPVKDYVPSIAGTVQPGGETGTWIYMDFNSLSWLANDRRQVQYLRAPGGGPIYQALRPGKPMRGVPVVVPEVDSRYNDEAILLTAGNREPWIPLTRDALLAARITALQARIDSLPAGAVLPAVIDRLRAELAQLVVARDAMPAAEKSLQAVVTNPYAPPESLFASAERGGRGLVTIDRHFLSKGAPKDDIQLITIYWVWEREDPAKVALMEQFRASFDIEALREVLASE